MRGANRHLAFMALALVLACGTAVDAQLIIRNTEPYRNYAYEGYRPYESLVFGRDRTPQFDNMGQFVMSGVNVFELQEFRTLQTTPGSIIGKERQYGDFLNRLVIANDSYKGVDTRLIVGDRIRTKFTPLTLDLAAMNGLRVDSNFKDASLVLAVSRVDRPIFEAIRNADFVVHGREGSQFRPSWSTYLLGADLRTKRPGLDLGVSWVNQYRTDSFKTLGENSFKGTLPTTGAPPLWLVLRVADQDPNDAIGVRVRRAAVVLNGRRLVHVPGPYNKLDTGELRLTVTEHLDRTIIPPIFRDSSNDLAINFPHLEPTPQGVYETRGEGSLLFWFQVPSSFVDGLDTLIVNKGDIEIDVAGDYLLELSEIFDGASFNPATYFYTAGQARGKPDNLDNFRRVRVRYGRETGRTLASVHANIDIKGYSLRTEYVRNFSYRAYPALLGTLGKHQLDQSQAWFAVLRRDLGRFSLGGEAFNIDAEYTTRLSVQDDSYQTYFQLINSPFQFPTNFQEPRLPDFLGPNRADATRTLEFDTVDDNDDKDPFPDTFFLRKTTSLEGGRFIEDPDGIFPGLDADLNGRPDINENNNRIPDYYEAFLLYKVNPDAYDYGEDTNNNGIIDEREDDLKPDYPYDQDRRGLHGFGSYRPRPGMKVTLGYHRTWAPFGGDQAEVYYGRYEYERRLPFLVDIYAVERLKRVRDEIADEVFGLGRDPIYFTPDIIPLRLPTEEELRHPLGTSRLLADPLLMRDSWVNTLYTRTRFIRVPNLNVEVSLKSDNNFQRRTSLQPNNRIADLATVFKADYLWMPWKQLRVMPQFKWLRQRLDDDEGQVLPIEEDFVYPILRMEYPISNRTVVKVGAQGLPFLKSLYRNKAAPGADFDGEDYVALVTNKSSYTGYQINVEVGYQRSTRKFKDRSRHDQGLNFSRVFLRMIAGLRPLF